MIQDIPFVIVLELPGVTGAQLGFHAARFYTLSIDAANTEI